MRCSSVSEAALRQGLPARAGDEHCFCGQLEVDGRYFCRPQAVEVTCSEFNFVREKKKQGSDEGRAF